MNIEEIQTTIERFYLIRDACYEAFMADPSLMGGDKWLYNAIQKSDMVLDIGHDSIGINGYCYTTQTMENEWFDFRIDTDLISLYLEGRG